MNGQTPSKHFHGKVASIALVFAALILVGCSGGEDRSKPEQRVSSTTNSRTKGVNSRTDEFGGILVTSTATSAGQREMTDAEVFGTVSTNVAPKLTSKQIAELKAKAEKGDSDAQFNLAELHAREGNESDYVKWMTRADKSGHAKAAYHLAYFYHARDYSAGTNGPLALHWLKVAAEHGLTDAQTTLATSYQQDSSDKLLSWGTGHDQAEAAKWYRKAADQGDASAQSTLGEMYMLGMGVPTNTSGGLSLLKQSIAGYEREANEAMTSTDFAHLSPAQRQEEARSSTMLAGLHSFSLADYYYQGVVVPKDITNAIFYYEKAAAAPGYYSSTAQFQLGCIHATETKNFAEAAKWFRKRAEAGDALGQRNLGACYDSADGRLNDDTEAAKWYRKAAEQGLSSAQADLGLFYMNGRGVVRDYQEGARWLKAAAAQGNNGAQNNLGVLYERGNGVPRDYVEAYKWYNVAAASADDAESRENSRKNLDGITRCMTPEQIAEAQRRSSAFVARKETPYSSIPAWAATQPVPERPQATGTALFITDDGYLLTCAHVVSLPEPKTADAFLDARPVTRIEVTVAGKTYSAKLVKTDKANDVAVLKISGTFEALSLAASRAVKLGDTICTIGFPNTELQGVEPKFTTGEINSLAGIQDDPRQFQISVPVQPGNSGGPLLDSSGNVIGLISARLKDITTLKLTGSLPQNVNYALKSSFISAFLETLPDVAAKLKSPRPAKARPLAEIADEAKPSVAPVTVF